MRDPAAALPPYAVTVALVCTVVGAAYFALMQSMVAANRANPFVLSAVAGATLLVALGCRTVLNRTSAGAEPSRSREVSLGALDALCWIGGVNALWMLTTAVW